MKPYENVEQLLEDSKIHGPYVIGLNNHIYNLITSIIPINADGSDVRIELSGHRHNSNSYEELLRFYTWQDGSPCGKLTEDCD